MLKDIQYFSARLQGVPYLLPWGQARADFCPAWELDALGERIFRGMEAREDIVSIARACSGLPGMDGGQVLPEDVQDFMDQIPASPIPAPFSAVKAWAKRRGGGWREADASRAYLSLAGLCLELSWRGGLPLPAMEGFWVEEPPPGVHTYGVDILPVSMELPPDAELILRHREMEVYAHGHGYAVEFPFNSHVQGMEYLVGAVPEAVLYCPGGLGFQAGEELYFALRLAVLCLAQGEGGHALHSASLVYKDRAWLFSGPSGMGKSTHVGMWQSALGVELLNGDLNLIKEHGRGWRVEGMPWCGTSGICTPKSYPLGGIILLHKGEVDMVKSLSPDKRQLGVYQRLISPFWTRDMALAQLEFAGRLVRDLPVWDLHCTKSHSAVYCIQEHIDRHLGALHG